MPVERYCFVMRLTPGAEEEYERRHDEIWPELVGVLHHSGVRNYTLFRNGTDVVGYAECHPDAATAWAAVASTEVNERWQVWLADLIAWRSDEAGIGFYREVWHLE